MSRLSIVLLCVTALVGVSCAKKDASGGAGADAPTRGDSKLATLEKTGSGAEELALPPKDARWTIFCQTITGANHIAASKQMKDELAKQSGLKGWYVVHEANQSILYYGFYRSFNEENDLKESRRAQADRAAIDRLTDKLGNRPFQHCFFVALNSPDPTAPAEWDLRNAKGFWTLQIAAYLDDPRRKEAAVESVREFRKAGIEAYFYHGETISSVCIGAWPEEAVARQEASVATAQNPNQPIMVSNMPLPSQMVKGLRDENNQPVKYLEARMDIVDPSMRRALEQYPEHAVNGYVQMIGERNPMTNEVVQRPEPSIVFQIPQPEPSMLSSAPMPVDSRGTDVLQPMPAQPRPAGKLRSVGN